MTVGKDPWIWPANQTGLDQVPAKPTVNGVNLPTTEVVVNELPLSV